MRTFEEIRKELLSCSYTWLITGVAGFIGAHLLKQLLQLNQQVVGLDNFATGFKSNIDDVLKTVDKAKYENFYFHEGDIRNLNDCKKVVKNVDFILHQAALGSVPRSIAQPNATHETNISGFLNILLAAKDARVKRFVYASSSSVYGDSPVIPKVEGQIGNPLSPYAVTKYTNELYANAFSKCYGIEAIGLRYFNIFGPLQNPNGPYAAVIPLWIKSIAKNETVYINGDGLTSRDFCYIDNAVQANILAATTRNENAINRVYNITVGEQTTLNELFALICEILNTTAYPEYRVFREGDIRHSLADITLAKELLGYQPFYTVKEGLKKTIEWFNLQTNRQ